MVTRRPIEITLVNTSDGGDEEYAEFPLQGVSKLKDWDQVRKMVASLNDAVGSAECVSNEPIELRIHSPHVPDLTLIDLPGYIAVNNKDQPVRLKEQIVQLCRRYIREPNIILAVCAANVDLANSEALSESRLVDPMGVRTMGVLTKMDLVEAGRGVALLSNKDYPLQLGYVGVVVSPQEPPTSANHAQLEDVEAAYFNHHRALFSPFVSRIGITTLRQSLVDLLHQTMSKSLASIVSSVRVELEDARYQFKVQYNDRIVTAESYLAELIAEFKDKIKSTSRDYSKANVCAQIRQLLDERVLALCSSIYWKDPRLADISTFQKWREDLEVMSHWRSSMDKAHGLLTKSGIGRTTTQAVCDNLIESIETIVHSSPFHHHPLACAKILELANELIKNRFYATADQVENTIKPYKYEIDFTEQEWSESTARAVSMLEEEASRLRRAFDSIQHHVGRRKLKAAMHAVNSSVEQRAAGEKNAKMERELLNPTPAPSTNDLAAPPSDTSSSSASSQTHLLPFPPKIMAQAFEAVQLLNKQNLINSRIASITPSRSSPCHAKFIFPPTTGGHPRSSFQHLSDDPTFASCRPLCPEPYLLLAADKLAHTAVMFIWIELLNEFFYLFPREIDNLLYYNLTPAQIKSFAAENPVIQRHLSTQERKFALEKAMDKLSIIDRAQKDARHHFK